MYSPASDQWIILYTPIKNYNGDIIPYFVKSNSLIMHDYKLIMNYYKILFFLSCNREIKVLE